MAGVINTRIWALCMLVCCAVTMATTNPGMKLKISQEGLNYAASVAIDQLASDVKGQTIPDQHGNEHHIKYDLTGMRVTSFSRPSSSIVVHPGQGITWSLANAGVSLHGDWKYKLHKIITIRDHGSFDVSVSGVSLTVLIKMGVDANGRPTISAPSCSCNVGSVHVKFHGHASWLYNIFRDSVEKPIRNKVKDILCKSVVKAIAKGETSLSKIKVRVTVESLLTLDYRLVAAPVFGSNFIGSSHKGEFYWTEKQTEAPFQAQAMGDPTGKLKMVTICLSDYVTKTLGYVLYTYGRQYLNYTLTKKNLPVADRHFLNTSTIPPLAKKYPHGSIELGMRVTAPPSLHTTGKVIVGNFNGQIDFNVRLPNGTVGKGFTGNVAADVVLSVKLTGDRVTARVVRMKFHTNITKSEVGPIPDVILQILLNAAARGFIIPKLNTIGEKGFSLPGIDHVQFVDPELRLMAGAICFTTSAKYNPTLMFKPSTKYNNNKSNRIHL